MSGSMGNFKTKVLTCGSKVQLLFLQRLSTSFQVDELSRVDRKPHLVKRRTGKCPSELQQKQIGGERNLLRVVISKRKRKRFSRLGNKRFATFLGHSLCLLEVSKA
ncbi:hypothetical protein F2P81_012170 [Scophthalmus maximus]|uniref:Uncharacterized protein n=1 Tax=Scophthalmus maximus TaxID=52904 RepID=A0A6A4SWG4_SCOMX|nr:hypothetical protein F2P81_012170 [Scophthalmus maximus]